MKLLLISPLISLIHAIAPYTQHESIRPNDHQHYNYLAIQLSPDTPHFDQVAFDLAHSNSLNKSSHFSAIDETYEQPFIKIMHVNQLMKDYVRVLVYRLRNISL